MKGKKSTRSAFLTSLMSLVLCFAMLLGTTFAWFTDTASTAVNKIQAGTLKVQLLDKNDNDLERETLKWVKADGTPFVGEVLWEPGCTYKLQSFKIKNAGDLKLKYRVIISGIDGNAKLNEAIEWTYTIAPNDGPFYPNEEGYLGAGDETELITITGHMKEEAGNEYQNLSINGIGITVLAAQATGEFDSINDQYDVSAEYPIVMSTSVETGADNKTTSAVTVESVNTVSVGGSETPTAKVTIPEGVQLNAGTTKVDPTIEETTAPANFTASAGMDNRTFEITMPGVASNNDEPITVEFFIGADLGNITLQHNGVPMTKVASATAVNADQDYFYDNTTGFLTLKSATFSPFTVEYPTQSWSGSGDNTLEAVDDVYSIGTAAELAQFAYEVNVKGTTFAGKTVKLTADIDLAGKNWAPVGQTGGYTAKTYFQGTFDGDGHTIRNLTIPESTWEAGSDGGTNFATGFFGFIDEGGKTIKNVTFENATVAGHHWVGVAAGYMTGTVEGVQVINSTITSTYKNGEADGDKAGGVVGYLNRGSVTGCTVTGSTITAVRDCGGVVGHSASGTSVTGNTAENCTVYYSTDTDAQIGGEIAGKRANGVSDNTATNVTVTKQLTVSTAAELSAALNKTYNSDITIKLANNINLAGQTWGEHTLEGTNNAALTIDGNGKTISGLTSNNYYNINGFNSNGLVTAIKSSLSSVTFKNLTVSGANLTNNGGAIAAAGVFVGDINTVKVTFDTCTVTGANVTSDAYAAGFVGYVQDVYNTDPNLNCPITLKNCTVTGSTFSGGDATGALIGLNNGATTITGATVTGNTINGGAGYSAAALVGTTVANVTATSVSLSNNTYTGGDTAPSVDKDEYGKIACVGNCTSYSVNGTELKEA